jgi:hypothetical protein
VVKRKLKGESLKTIYRSTEVFKGQHPKTGKRHGVKSTRAIVGSALKQHTGSGKVARKIISKERSINARR